jgi:hypothetical protein
MPGNPGVRIYPFRIFALFQKEGFLPLTALPPAYLMGPYRTSGRGILDTM